MTTGIAKETKSIVTEAVAGIGDIATLPEVTIRIIDIVEDPKSTARDLHGVIKTDPALSAKILKVVNSAFYGLPGQIDNMDRAIVLLGLSAVKNIAIAASISRLFKGDKPHPHFSARDLWRHSVGVAVASRQLIKASGHAGGTDELFLAGLIHDLGMLVERQAFGERFLDVVEKCANSGQDFLSVEIECFGADHQEFGQALATRWKFPKHLLCATGHHHASECLPEKEKAFVSFVHLADILCCQENIGFSLSCRGQEITPELLDSCDLDEEKVAEVRDMLEENVSQAEATLM